MARAPRLGKEDSAVAVEGKGDEIRIVVAEEQLVYVFAREADAERFSLHDVPTYRRTEKATSEEVEAAIAALDGAAEIAAAVAVAELPDQNQNH